MTPRKSSSSETAAPTPMPARRSSHSNGPSARTSSATVRRKFSSIGMTARLRLASWSLTTNSESATGTESRSWLFVAGRSCRAG